MAAGTKQHFTTTASESSCLFPGSSTLTAGIELQVLLALYQWVSMCLGPAGNSSVWKSQEGKPLGVPCWVRGLPAHCLLTLGEQSLGAAPMGDVFPLEALL